MGGAVATLLVVAASRTAVVCGAAVSRVVGVVIVVTRFVEGRVVAGTFGGALEVIVVFGPAGGFVVGRAVTGGFVVGRAVVRAAVAFCVVGTEGTHEAIPGCVAVENVGALPFVQTQFGSPSSWPFVNPSPSLSFWQSPDVHLCPAALKSFPN